MESAHEIVAFVRLGLGPFLGATRLNVHSMFDWPAASQTSPTSTSLIAILFLPWIVSTLGSEEASSGSRVTIHFLSAPGVAFLTWPPNSTVTSSPESAQPHTGVGTPRWRTIWSPIIFGKMTSATAGVEATSIERIATANSRRMPRRNRTLRRVGCSMGDRDVAEIIM